MTKLKRILSVLMVIALLAGSMTGLDLACVEPITKAEAAVYKDAVDLTAGDPYYVMTVETGVTPGTDVLYFTVRYVDDNNDVRTDFIFPNAGALKEGYELVEKLMTEAGLVSPAARKRSLMKSEMNVETPDILKGVDKSLQSNTVDEFFFATNYPMKEVVGIDVCVAAGKKSWYCGDISVYRVNYLRGIDMIGYYSSQYFIDFDGTMIARAPLDRNIQSDEKYGVVARFREDSSNYILETVNTFANTKDESGAEAPVDTHHPFVTNYAAKIDIAQSNGAGIAGFIQDAQSHKSIKGLFGSSVFPESLTLYIKYKDMGGIRREAYIPVCTNLICYLIDQLNAGDKCLYGIGQDSDSIVIPITLPGIEIKDNDNRALEELNLYYSQNYAKAACEISYTVSAKTVERDADEFVAIGGFQILRNMPDVSIDDENNRLKVNFDRNDVMMYYVSNDYSGTKIVYSDAFTAGKDDIHRDISKVNYLNLGNVLISYQAKAKDADRIEFKPSLKGDSYLITLGIDDYAKNAETLNNITVYFNYVDIDGNDVKSQSFSVKEGVDSFYGAWATTKGQNNGQGAYQIKSVQGGVLQFIANIADVSKFISINVKVEKEGWEGSSSDDLALKSVEVHKFVPGGLGGIKYKYDKTGVLVNGSASNWELEREFSLLENKYGAYYAEEKKAVLFIPGNAQELFFAENERVEQEDVVDWYEYTNSMSFAATQTDMGYTKRRETYRITVDVPSDKNNDNLVGDSGSKNQFYFKLLFETGDSSGYVLANQQLSSDCFNSGRKETFYIYTNYDYGEVIGIKIIPDAQQANSDIYDKLKINDVIVTRLDKQNSKNWICHINDWVGIDYYDDGASMSAKGQASKSEAEVARTYSVTSTSYDVNLMFEIGTEGYGIVDRPLTGSMYATIEYRDVNNALQTQQVDVYSEMYAYMDMVENRNKDNDAAVIDPYTMLLPGTDSVFTLSLSKVKKLVSIEFKAYNATEDSAWDCRGVKVSQIIGGTGGLYLNAAGLRVRDYDTRTIADTDNEGVKNLSVGRNDLNGKSIKYNFRSDEIVFVRETNAVDNNDLISDDSLNFYVHVMNTEDNPTYPFRMRDNAGNTKYDMSLNLRYSYNAGMRGNRTSLIDVQKMAYSTQSHLFYCSVDVKGLRDIINFGLKALVEDSNKLLSVNSSVLVDYVVAEHVRNGAVIATYEIDLDGTDITSVDDLSWKPKRSSGSMAGLSQKLVLSLDGNTQTQTLSGTNTDVISDVSVALRYKSSYARKVGNETVYTTTAKYLSTLNQDESKYTIRPHQLLEIEYNQNYVDEIVGIEIVNFGDATAFADAAAVTQCNDASGNIVKAYSYYGENELGDEETKQRIDLLKCFDKVEPESCKDIPTVGFMQLTVKTGSSEENFDKVGVHTPLKAIVSWADEAGNNHIFDACDDIGEYIVEGKGIMPNESAVINIPLQYYSMLHSITLIPYDPNFDVPVEWLPESVGVKVINPKNGTVAEYTTDIGTVVTGCKDVNGFSGGYRKNYATIAFGGSIAYKYTSQEGANSEFGENFADGMSIKVDSGSCVVLEATSANSKLATDKDKFIRGSYEDIDVTVRELYLEGTTEQSALVNGNVKLYTRRGGFYEEIMPNIGYADNRPVISKIEFAANAVSTADVTYLLTLTSVEFPEKSIEFKITVAGLPEEIVDIGTDVLDETTNKQTGTDDTTNPGEQSAGGEGESGEGIQQPEESKQSAEEPTTTTSGNNEDTL